MPRRNRVDPWGDLHAVAARGLFTGNRGCVVDAHENVVRHHSSSLWIICKTKFRDWRWPLARPNRWTPLFMVDDAVGLAAGHRPCGLCRRDAYRSYQTAVMTSRGDTTLPNAAALNKALQRARLRKGRGIDRAQDRILWRARVGDLPDGTVVVNDRDIPNLLYRGRWHEFSFNGWASGDRIRNLRERVTVLTPPTSVAALKFGFQPTLKLCD